MRRMVTDGTAMFRAVVVRNRQIANPDFDFERGTEQPYWLLLDETDKTEYGPYNQIGTAKATLTREAIDTWNPGRKFKWGVVDAWIERATTTWERVE